MKIDEWVLQAKYLGTKKISGKVYGNPEFEEGEPITTSSVIGKTEDGKLITKSGSIYELGNPAEDYERAYPSARDRVLEQLDVVKS